MKQTKILVTGASGFIGATFLKRFAGRENLLLCGAGRRPVHDFPPSVRYVPVTLDQLDNLDFQPDVVIHAAGRCSPWGSPQEYQQDNVATTRQVIDFCHRRGFPRLIFLSTAAVYYRFAHQQDIPENAPIGPAFTSEYGRSKYQAEQQVADYPGEKTIFRPCAVFGPGDRLLLPPLVKAARCRKLPGLDSGTVASRADLMHVDTLCDYLLSAATHPRLRPCYNISANCPVETQKFLCDLLHQLGLPQPEKKVRLNLALRAASLMELLWRWLPLKGEPPITRFGVAVFGYSATLDVSHMLNDFGPPAVGFHPLLARFIQYYRVNNL
jgi:nucleoside-diphosphate-sugar epimerase